MTEMDAELKFLEDFVKEQYESMKADSRGWDCKARQVALTVYALEKATGVTDEDLSALMHSAISNPEGMLIVVLKNGAQLQLHRAVRESRGPQMRGGRR